MSSTVENPFGTDAMTAPASESYRIPRKAPKRTLPPAPRLKDLVVKLILL